MKYIYCKEITKLHITASQKLYLVKFIYFLKKFLAKIKNILYFLKNLSQKLVLAKIYAQKYNSQ